MESSEHERPTRVRHVVLFFLAIIATAAYLTRHCLAALNTTMQAELHFNNEQFGYLYSAFSLGYLLCQIPGGWLGQKIGTRKTLPLLSILWSMTTLATAIVSSLWAILITRFAYGLAQGGLIPNEAKVVQDWFPPSSRGFSSSVITMAMSFGSVITMSLTALLMPHFHWRFILQMYALVGIVWAGGFLLIFRTKPEHHPLANRAECDLISPPQNSHDQSTLVKSDGVSQLLCNRNVWILALQLLCSTAAYNFFVTFFPAFLEYAYEIKKEDAGLLTTYPLIGKVIGSLLGGILIDQIYRRTASKRLSRCGVAASGLVLAVLLMTASIFTENANQLATVVGFAAFCSGLTLPCLWTSVIDLGKQNSAITMGIINSVGCLAGFIISPLVGKMIDHIKATNGNWNHVILLHALFYALAGVCWLFIQLDGNTEK